MNWRRNGILILLASILITWYYYYEIKGSIKREKAEIESARVIPGLEVSRMSDLTITRIPKMPEAIPGMSDQSYLLKFSRKEDLWTLLEPCKAECNQSTVDTLASAIAELQRKPLITGKPDSLAIYGLDAPGFLIDIGYDTGRMQIKLGDENPAGDAYYAAFEGDTGVYLISNEIKNSLFRKVNDYRKRNIVDASRDSISGLTVEFPAESKTFEFIKNNMVWSVRETEEAPGDDSRIQELLASLTAQSIEDFIDQPGELSEYGLLQPQIRISASMEDSTRTLIEIGNHADEGGKTRYGRRDASGPVFIVKKDFYDVFKPDFFYYRSKNVCDMNREIVNRISIETSQDRIELVRNDSGGWGMVASEKLEADALAVGSYLSNLTYLRATGLKPVTEPFGETEGVVRLYAGDSTETPLTVLEIGGIPPDGVGRWLKTSDESGVFRISESDAASLIPGVFHFRIKNILRLDKSQIETIRIEHGIHAIEFEPDDISWRLTAPEGEEVSEKILDDIFRAIHQLDMDAVIRESDDVPTAAELGEYGLEDVDLRLIVTLKGGQKETLNMSFADDSRVIVHRPGDTMIASIEASKIQPLLDFPWDKSSL